MLIEKIINRILNKPSKSLSPIFEKRLQEFRQAVIRSSTVSYGGVGILTSHARETYCSIIFTKLVGTAHSILRLCPSPKDKNYHQAPLDYTAIAALSRVIIDTFIALYHFGLEDCEEDEYQARQLLLFWKDHRVRIKMGVIDDEGAAFHNEDIKKRLDINSFWQTIPEKHKRHLLKSNAMLHSPFEIIERAGFDAEWNKKIYSYWSAHTHCDPVAFIRMTDQIRGRGIVNQADLELTSVCLEYVTKILNFSSNKVDKVLIGAEARGRSIKTFDPFAVIHESPPWERRLTMADLKAQKSDEEEI